mmetsp:Transcript_25594/g.52071  ORF Transcript_25594/g.52071 Transcript_25594/m.52071 type:complete len:1147 (+) Transcript_25594:262-3702(+)|eukprot:CAMPEP_0181347896 /NCGR_PEP_ID=MMETSP1101-20121128/34119_1 /TAXON_ID=46948 /ORGANISM="Rhodomonas abbreviata, Strain Caron Lab Isolate" /LENGTH=1146 /DNA_ID=CAMNT_0023460133 /DNA_START=230 /DNA_END=3670 /DNA_ORIENTATION=+
MFDLLSDGNVAGKNLLSIVSRGSAIVAELLRLSDHVPPVFYLAEKADQAKYGLILHDFSYLKNAELHESRISGDPNLVDLDEEFRESNLELVERFYRMFESIFRYVKDLTRYLEDVEEGVYIQIRLEDLLVSESGKQLLAEAFYLYGIMLILMDNRIEGSVRERMLICYYRYKGGSDTHSAVCNLCRATGFSPVQTKRPAKYPEDFFSRLTPPIPVIRMIINRLRSDDVYNQMKEWPNPDHRCTALSTQAAILYVVLFFVPDVLEKEAAAMREIVDKHFSDNWVISFYMGYVVDLSVMWEPYKAANAALKNTLEPKQVKETHRKQVELVEQQLKELGDLLREGVLTDEVVLDSSSKLFHCLRACNSTLRWAMLHRTARNKKLRDVMSAGLPPEKILLLLLHTAQLEFKLGEHLKGLLESKGERWAKAQRECAQSMTELSHFFSGEHALTRNIKDPRLQEWFASLATEVSSLSLHDSTLAGRKMQQLSAALEDVEQFHQIEGNAHVKHFLQDARSLLRQMVRTVNVKEEQLITLATVADLSYAFDVITDFVPLMHRFIKQDPFAVLLLRATFLKLASVLELPLVRINQAASEDLSSVAEYYSSQLVAFVRDVLEVVPVNMFLILNDIIATQTTSMQDLPPRLEKASLKEFSQLEQRYRLARSTHQVSVFTEGVLAMETTLVGIVEVDPKQLLQEGIRKELTRQIAMALHGMLIFPNGTLQDMHQRLEKLHKHLDGFRKSFEYISDYVNIYGLKIWQEEFSRIINFNVEQECNTFLRKKTYAWESRFQSTAIPIPVYAPVDEHSRTFIGRLVREILLQTDRNKTVYLDAQSGWYDPASGKEVFGIRTCSLLHQSIGAIGVRGVDRTLGFLIARDLQDAVRFYRRQGVVGLKVFLPEFEASLDPTTSLPASASKLYASALSRTAKLWPWFADTLSRVGQVQLLRRQLASELIFGCRLDSPTLASALEVMNEALLNDIEAHYAHPDVKPYPSEEKQLLPGLAPLLDTSGLCSPLLKIYIASEPLPRLPHFLFLFALSQVASLRVDKATGLLVAQDKSGSLDTATLIIGLGTLLKQFHSSVTRTFIALLAQYVRCHVVVAARDPPKGKAPPLPAEVVNVLVLLRELCKYGHVTRALVHQHLPPYLFDSMMA